MILYRPAAANWQNERRINVRDEMLRHQKTRGGGAICLCLCLNFNLAQEALKYLLDE